MPTLLFVHGTGVRGEAFDRTLAVIVAQAARHLPGWRVRGCNWGQPHGARLLGPSAAVPGYESGRNAAPRPERERRRAAELRWSLLYDDPLYELRTFAALAETSAGDDGLGGSDRAPRGDPAAAVVAALRELLPSHGGVARCGHLAVELLAPALALLVADGVLARALQAPPLADPARLRPLVGRAFAAAWAQAAARRGLPPLDGELRDSLVQDAVARLGTPKGLKDELLGALAGLASRLATPVLRWQRSAISDAHLEASNDILLYQTAHGGAAIRGHIAQTIRDCGEPVLLLAHSLGGIASVELLVEQPALPVSALVTCGSQAPFLVESDALAVLRRGAALPPGFPKWLNVFDLDDLLSYAAGGVFVGRVEDLEVASGQPFPESHGAYWAQRALWEKLAGFAA